MKMIKTRTLTAVDETFEIGCGGLATVGVDLSGEWTGQVVFEAKIGDGAWGAICGTNLNLLDGQLIVTATGNGIFAFPTVQVTKFRIKVISITGSVVVNLTGDPQPGVILQLLAYTFIKQSASDYINTKEYHPATPTVTSVNSSDTSVTLLASNANAKQRIIFNNSTQILYIKFGTTASASDWTYKVEAGAYWPLPHPCYTGRIDGIWAAANGNAKITEVA